MSLLLLTNIKCNVPGDQKSKRTVRRPAGHGTPSQQSRPGGIDGKGQLTASEEKAAKLLLGQLYNDRQFLDKLLKEEGLYLSYTRCCCNNTKSDVETRPVKHAKGQKSKVRELCSDGLAYLDNRTEFWRQQKPVSQRSAGRQGTGRTTTATRDLYLAKVCFVLFLFLSVVPFGGCRIVG